jgi:hypothetical protein
LVAAANQLREIGIAVVCGAVTLRTVSSLAKIQAATESLPQEEQEELYRILDARLHPPSPQLSRARLVRKGGDLLLEAPPGAPPMSPESVKRMLEDWP